MQGLEGREPIAIIVDDSQAVWPHDRRNLYVVERYIYFPSSKERFGLQGLSLLEIDRCGASWQQGQQQGRRRSSGAAVQSGALASHAGNYRPQLGNQIPACLRRWPAASCMWTLQAAPAVSQHSDQVACSGG